MTMAIIKTFYDRFNLIDKGVYFDGEASTPPVVIADAGGIYGGHSAFSVEFFFKKGDANQGGTQYLMRTRNGSSTSYAATFYFRIGATDALAFYASVGSSSDNVISSPILDTKWHHCVGTWEAEGHQILYLDGVAVDDDDGSLAGVSNAMTNLYVGTDYRVGSNNDNLHGSISILQIWNRIITPTEVLQLKEGKPITSGLIGKWNINEGTGTTLNDELEVNDGTINDAAWVGGALGIGKINGIEIGSLDTWNGFAVA